MTNPTRSLWCSNRRFLLALCSVALLAASCSGADSRVATTAVDDGAPDAPLAPLAVDADGKAVYLARCAACHGDDLRGTEKGPSQLSIVYEPNHHGDAAFRSAIRNGAQQHHWDFGDMPPVPDITDEQIELVIAYIRLQQQELGLE